MEKEEQSLEELENRVLQHYLSSGDFNGYRACDISADEKVARQAVFHLLDRGNVLVLTESVEINPHINRLGFPPLERVRESVKESNLYHTTLYPSRDFIKKNIEITEFISTPYTLELALGEAQLAFRFFDTDILDWYQANPKYTYYFDDIRGRISIGDKAYESDETLPRDKVHIKSLGVAYNDRGHHCIAAFVRDLSGLSPEHQSLWRARELSKEGIQVHPDFYRNTILGEWGEYISIYDALIEETHVINEMCDSIGWPGIFKRTFKVDRPRDYGTILRPTKKRYESFVHVLDKLLGDNLNHDFFKSQGIDRESMSARSDGTTVITHKGTIQMLEEWIGRSFRSPHGNPAAEVAGPLKAVRKARQPSAHALREDEFSLDYIQEQRDIIKSAYNAVRTLRLILANHPGAATVPIPSLLETGDCIWSL